MSDDRGFYNCCIIGFLEYVKEQYFREIEEEQKVMNKQKEN